MLALVLLLAAQASDSEWDHINFPAKDPVWYDSRGLSDYWIERGQVQRTADGTKVRFWMNGYHIRDKALSYRRSLDRVTIDCANMKFQINASTTYKANGDVQWTYDYPDYSAFSLIRPVTMYQSIADKYCTSGQ